MRASSSRLISGSGVMGSKAAAAGHGALDRRVSLVIAGLRNRLLAASARQVPIRTAASVARKLLDAG